MEVLYSVTFIFKLFLQNFKNSLLELREGKPFSAISLPVVPRTEEDAERIRKRGEKTKEGLYLDLMKRLNEVYISFPGDEYVYDTRQFLKSKSFKSFNPKSELVKLVLEVDSYLDNLEFDKMSSKLVVDEESEDEENFELDSLIC